MIQQYVVSWWAKSIKLYFFQYVREDVASSKSQLISESIYEVIISPKMQNKNYKDFCPTKQTRIVALFFVIF